MTEISIVGDQDLVNINRIPISTTKLVLNNNNNLRDFSALSRLYQLQHLEIADCPQLADFEVFSKACFDSLTYLDVSGNDFGLLHQQLGSFDLSLQKQLDTVWICDRNLEATKIQLPPNVKKLGILGCRIRYLAALDCCKHVRELLVGNNLIASIDAVSHCTELVKLIVPDN